MTWPLSPICSPRTMSTIKGAPPRLRRRLENRPSRRPAFFQARLTGVPDLRVSIETSLAAGDKAAASFVYEGAHGGVYYGVAPTGRPMRFTSCDIFRVRDGRIAEHWGMSDIAGALAQLKG